MYVDAMWIYSISELNGLIYLAIHVCFNYISVLKIVQKYMGKLITCAYLCCVVSLNKKGHRIKVSKQ